MSIRRLKINLPDAPAYEVRIGSGAISKLPETISQLRRPNQVAMIVDSNVAATAGARVHGLLEEAGIPVSDLGVPAGEQSKSLEVAGELYRALAMLSLGRDDLVIAVGGGVIGDLAGFVASTYMRGVPCIQVPTTLLAMVDSSVGGKTAINLAQGKNLVGTFTQPLHVVADTDFLSTLPEREWQCGMGEIAKTAVIGTAEFYSWLSRNVEGLAAHGGTEVEDAVAQCVAYKADVVIHDEHETSGLRERLNLGHTFAHALEKVAGWGVFSHGLAVAEGMRFASRLAVEAVDAPVDLVTEQDALLDLLSLDAIPQAFAPDELLEAMHSDKKARGGKLRFVLARAQGDIVTAPVDDELVLTHLNAWAASKERS